MEILKIPFIRNVHEDDVQQISLQLDQLKVHQLQHILWPTSTYKPAVQFAIGYSDEAIYLKYFVQENHLQACYTTDNSPVHLDSCVEFFIAFNNEKNYYNLEFNCLGTCLAGFGDSREGRQLLTTAVLSKIKRHATLKTFIDKGEWKATWELTLLIPVTLFAHHQLPTLKGVPCKGNFYKCGDALPTPHYLAWNEVKSATPNFHLPEYFGCLQFD